MIPLDCARFRICLGMSSLVKEHMICRRISEIEYIASVVTWLHKKAHVMVPVTRTLSLVASHLLMVVIPVKKVMIRPRMESSGAKEKAKEKDEAEVVAGGVFVSRVVRG